MDKEDEELAEAVLVDAEARARVKSVDEHAIVSSSVSFDQSTAVGSNGVMPHFRNPFLIVDMTMLFSNASRKMIVKLFRLKIRRRLDIMDISFA